MLHNHSLGIILKGFGSLRQVKVIHQINKITKNYAESFSRLVFQLSTWMLDRARSIQAFLTFYSILLKMQSKKISFIFFKMCFENIEGKFTFQKTDHIKKFTNNNFFLKNYHSLEITNQFYFPTTPRNRKWREIQNWILPWPSTHSNKQPFSSTKFELIDWQGHWLYIN